MPTTITVRASEQAKSDLKALSKQLGLPMTSVLGRALKLLKRQMKFARGKAAYAALRQDEKAWKQFQRERDGWEHAAGDPPARGAA